MSTRPYSATLHRKHGPDKGVIWTRHYASLKNAIKRAVEIAVQEGEPKDVVEFYHYDLGFQLATVTIHAMGKVTVDWSPVTEIEAALKKVHKAMGRAA